MKLLDFFSGVSKSLTNNLVESRVIDLGKLEGLGGDVRVYLNPTYNDLVNLLERVSGQLRGIMTEKNVYVWDAFDYVHGQIFHCLKRIGLTSYDEEGGIDPYVLSFYVDYLDSTKNYDFTYYQPVLGAGRLLIAQAGKAPGIGDDVLGIYQRHRVTGSWKVVGRELVEAQVIKAFIPRVDLGDGEVTIWKNPTFSQLRSLVSQYDLRGKASSEDVYVWRAADSIHADVSWYLQAQLKIRGMSSAFESDTIYIHMDGSSTVSHTWQNDEVGQADFERDGVIVKFSRDKPVYGVLNRVIRSWYPREIRDDVFNKRLEEVSTFEMENGHESGKLNEVQVLDTTLDFKIYKNPTWNDIISLVGRGDLRGIVTRQAVFVWNARMAGHRKVDNELKIDGEFPDHNLRTGIYIHREGSVDIPLEWISDPRIEYFIRDRIVIKVDINNMEMETIKKYNKVFASWFRERVLA